MTDDLATSLKRGAALIRKLARELPDRPGVYRMLAENGDVLYVGKARSLRRRVSSYANVGKLSVRIQRMVAQTHDMAFVHTHTEVEALLLESNLIKKLKPRYNVLLRDDKSFPYIMITGDHDFPLLTKHRGARRQRGDYFGPFANAGAVNRTINALQRAFMLRNCSDAMFAQRTRPCLQYHIKRCTAPCVNYVSKAEYAAQVGEAKAFLKGSSRDVQGRMAEAMQMASDALDFEAAARWRDRIRALTSIQARQDINVRVVGDADVMGLFRKDGQSCVQVFFFRGGQNYGNRAYYPRHSAEDDTSDILGAFMAQFYENKPIPREVILSHDVTDAALLAEALEASGHSAGRVTLTIPQRGQKKRLVEFVVNNAQQALEQERLKLAGQAQLLDGVAEAFGLERPPQRIEVFDNSHVSGTNMVGAMIVAGPDGFNKNAYRKFNIRTADAADDYGMMREVMERRFGRARREGKGPGDEDWPDLVLIDGGQGQLSSVLSVIEDLGIDGLCIAAVAKGPDRNAGRETFYMPGQAPFQMDVHDPVLHYLQRLRDEAHRFAIGAHRTRRAKAAVTSVLDGVPGIGPKRKKALLHHFGSGQEVARAGLADLMQVEGISESVARRIYDYFHER